MSAPSVFFGLTPLIQEEYETKLGALRDLVTGASATTFANLEAAGSASLPITRGVIEALGSSPEGAEAQKILRAAESKVEDPNLLLQAYEDALDRAYFENLLETIPPNNQENTRFLTFVKKEVDAKNIQTLLRLVRRRDEETAMMGHLILNGYEFGTADLRRLSEASTLEELVERLKEFRLYNDLKTELDALAEGGSLADVQVALTRSLADFAQRFAYSNPLSVLPIINYFMRKNLEVRNLRAIARGKQAGLSEEEIERLLVVI